MENCKKYILALILNVASFFLTCLLYEGGIAVSLMLPILQFGLNLLNYKWTKRILSFTILNFVMLVSSVASIKIDTLLYYNNVSSDIETLAVGDFEAWFCVVFVLLMTLISIICRNFCKRKRYQYRKYRYKKLDGYMDFKKNI